MLPLSYVDDAKKPTARPRTAIAGMRYTADWPTHCIMDRQLLVIASAAH